MHRSEGNLLLEKIHRSEGNLLLEKTGTYVTLDAGAKWPGAIT